MKEFRLFGQSLGDKKKKILIYIIMLLGVLLFVFGNLAPTSPKETGEKSGQSANETEQALEERLSEILSEMEGMGEVRVMITYADDGEEILAQNTRMATASSEYEAVMATGSGGNRPYVVGRERARIQGVLVVADGGDQASVQETIKEAVCALTGVYHHNVVVSGRRMQ